MSIYTSTTIPSGTYIKHRYWRFIQESVLNSHAPRVCELRWVDADDALRIPITYTRGGSWFLNESLWNTSFDGVTNNSDIGWIVANTGWIQCDFGTNGYCLKSFGAYVSYSGARGARWLIQYSDDASTWTTIQSWDFLSNSGTGWYLTTWTPQTTTSPSLLNVEVKSLYRGISGVNRDVNQIARSYNGVNRSVFGGRTYLYKEGDENVSLTGGWVGGKYITDYRDNIGTYTKYSGYLYAQAGSASSLVSAGWFTTNKIDLTNYSKLLFNLTQYYAGYGVQVTVDESSRIRGTGAEAKEPTGIGVCELDISSFTGLYYVGFGVWAYGSYIGVDKVWLE